MSEIKGQLLGIILTLMVFGATSVIVAHVYATSASKVNDYAHNVEQLAGDEVGFDIPTSNGAFASNAAVEFPGLSY